MVSESTVWKFFGTWKNALAKAGYRSIEQEMHEDLKAISGLNSARFFSYNYYKTHGGKFARKTLEHVLGESDWNALLQNILSLSRPPKQIRRVKIQRKRVPKYTEEQLFSELERVWKKIGRRPTYAEFRTMGTIGTKVYEIHFGNWTKAVETFSLRFAYYTQSNDTCNVTPALLLAELKTVASKVIAPVMTFDDYKEHGGVHSRITFQNHFGSWRLAVEEVGKRDGVGKGRYSTEDLFAELQRVWELIGRQPKKGEMNQLGNIRGSLFEQRFGSWMKAIHAFCSDRENLDDATRAYNENDYQPPQSQADDQKKESNVDESENYIVMRTSRTPSLRLRFNVFKRDNFRCMACGRSPASHPGLELEIDHDVPYSVGGETVIENLRTLCRDCNRGKGNLIE